MQMKGMVAIVTGASRGLGKAISLAYAAEGATVVACSRPNTPTGLSGTADDTAAEIRASGGQALGLGCDVTDDAQVKAMVERVNQTYGRIDVLVNNAGLMIINEPFLDIEPNRWDNLMAVNVRGPYLCCRYVLPAMIEQKRGSVVNIGSRMGKELIPGGGTAYSASKAALHMVSHALAEEMQQHNIAVNVLSPGSMRSEGSWQIPWNRQNWDTRIDPSQNGPGVVFLALQSAQTMTGQYVHVDDFGKTWGPGISASKVAG
jgi:NAD(P)-dependent dehydrogenase (short-subunit alcohol dehydrogenase family)